MALNILIPPCYNEGDNPVVVEQPKKLDIKALEMFARLSGAVNSNNVFCVPDVNSDDVIMLIVNNTKIKAIEQHLMDAFLAISRSVKIKGVINKGIILSYFADKEVRTGSSVAFTHITIDDLDTSNMTTCKYMFYKQNVTELDLRNFDTSNTINMSEMFSICSSLKSLDLSNFNTSNVTDMNAMFYRCESLQKLDLSSFDTSKVTAMDYMFCRCNSLQKLDLSNFNTSNVTDMSFMFESCKSLSELHLNNFNTSKVIQMCQMFKNCANLRLLDLSNFDTHNVQDMAGMFTGCKQLKSVNLSNFNFCNTHWINEMFLNCESLTSLDLSNADLSNVYNMQAMFKNCKKLETVQLNIRRTGELNMDEMFCGCTNLKSVSFLANVDIINMNVTNMFRNAVIQELNLENFIASNKPCMFNKTTVVQLNLKNANFDNVSDLSSVFLNQSTFHTVQISKSDKQLLDYFKQYENYDGSKPIIEIV